MSGIRIHSEHCIGFLKGRWSSLRCLPVHIDNSEGLRYATLWVSACVYLHAFAMNHEDGRFYSQDQFYKDGQAYMKEQRIQERRWRRHERQHNTNEENRREEARDLELLEGKIKREELKEQLFRYIDHTEE